MTMGVHEIMFGAYRSLFLRMKRRATFLHIACSPKSTSTSLLKGSMSSEADIMLDGRNGQNKPLLI